MCLERQSPSRCAVQLQANASGHSRQMRRIQQASQGRPRIPRQTNDGRKDCTHLVLAAGVDEAIGAHRQAVHLAAAVRRAHARHLRRHQQQSCYARYAWKPSLFLLAFVFRLLDWIGLLASGWRVDPDARCLLFVASHHNDQWPVARDALTNGPHLDMAVGRCHVQEASNRVTQPGILSRRM